MVILFIALTGLVISQSYLIAAASAAERLYLGAKALDRERVSGMRYINAHTEGVSRDTIESASVLPSGTLL